jgi:predicted Zn-dependent peptidase
LPVSFVGLSFDAGARFDPAGKNGLAHLLEHLLANRSPKSSKTISWFKNLEKIGIYSNAETNYETCFYHHIQPAQNTIESAELLLSGIFKSRFDQSGLSREKKVILNEAEQNFNNPQNYIWRLSNKSLWPHNSLGKDLFGGKTSLEKIKIADILRFYDDHYLNGKVVFVLVGHRPCQGLEELLKKYFKKSRKTLAATTEEKFSEPVPLIVEKRKTDQVIVSLAFRTVALKELKMVSVCQVLCNYLANHWSSKLIQSLRLEKRLTYWVEGETANFSDAGMMRFIFSCSAKDLRRCLFAISKEIVSLKTKLANQSDLELTKNYYLSSFIRESIDPYNLAWWYAWQATINTAFLSANNFMTAVKKVNREDLKNIANKIFLKDNFSLSLIGSVDKKFNYAKWLKF